MSLRSLHQRLARRSPREDREKQPKDLKNYHEEKRFSSPQSLIEVLANRIAKTLRRAVKARGYASIVVSSGRVTPVALFEQLSILHVPWSAVWITLSDERWVSVDSPGSNEGLVRRTLLKGPVKEAHFVGLKNDESTPEAGQATCHEALLKVPRPFDVVVLGMGEDGHIASLFSGTPQLAAALDPDVKVLCRPIRPVSAPHPRLTLTLPALLDSRWIVIHIVGDRKRRVYRQACEPGPSNELTVRAILQQNKVPVDVYWAP